MVLIDLAVNPFEADVGDMVEMAVAAERTGYRAVWVPDHFSGAVVGRRWSRDPFVCLGAMAASTSTIELGVLVANMRNRHPAQLASAINSLQSLAPSRVRLGIGSGAAPGSRFAVEHEAIGTDFGTASERRSMLRSSIDALRSMWAAPGGDGGAPHDVDHLEGGGADMSTSNVVDGAARPPIVVGASAWPTIELALATADGVNVRRSAELDDLLRRIDAVRHPSFEVSVLDAFDDVADDPARIDQLAALGVDRLVLGMSAPHDPFRLTRLELS